MGVFGSDEFYIRRRKAVGMALYASEVREVYVHGDTPENESRHRPLGSVPTHRHNKYDVFPALLHDSSPTMDDDGPKNEENRNSLTVVCGTSHYLVDRTIFSPSLLFLSCAIVDCSGGFPPLGVDRPSTPGTVADRQTL